MSLLDFAHNACPPCLIVFKYQGGYVHLPGGEKFEYLLAEFGVKVPTGELKLDGPPNPPRTCVVESDTHNRHTAQAWSDRGIPIDSA